MSTWAGRGLEVTRASGHGAAWEHLRGPRGRQISGRQISNADARAILTAVLDAGITYLDTSNDDGRSEELIGRFIGPRRNDYILATKCGCVPGGGEHVWAREDMFRGLEESLQRLQTGYVEVMQLHNASRAEAETERVVDTLEEMRAQGRVRWIGASTTLPHLPAFLKWGVFDVIQIPYAAILREHEAWITRASQVGIGTVIRGVVGKGEPGVALASGDRWTPYANAGLDALREDGESPTAFMLRYTLSHPDVHPVIAGTLNPDHLAENVAAAQRGGLPADVYAEAKRRLDLAGESPAAANCLTARRRLALVGEVGGRHPASASLTSG